MKGFLDSNVPDTHCPVCHKDINGAASFDMEVPSPGDISICFYCESTLVFTENPLTLRVPYPDEFSEECLEDIELMKHLLRQAKEK